MIVGDSYGVGAVRDADEKFGSACYEWRVIRPKLSRMRLGRVLMRAPQYHYMSLKLK